ncbi:Metallo-dependent phosphatase-like protein [Stachybotrys elegans]|uniref:Metallo-dependent phosphatase-like protein n=1 Tax=Stachybotrys elegans TaxID=80388 RepID=A0A8K0SMC2_9HYPO|nr:Metallo-dependent phosphatase-like protein [Stachybotrys elegans]
MASPRFRRTRIVCISDTHNCTVNLPEGDVLIHAGDLTNQGSYSELSRAVKWLESTKFEAKIVIAGNHDVTLDKDFYAEHGSYFHNQDPQSSADCLSLLASSSSITYLCHSSATVRLSSPDGPHTIFTIFGSPYSPRHGLWAFYYDAPTTISNHSELTNLWGSIPLDTDIVVTHTPARTHCDETDERRATGCEALRRALWRVRPRLAVCGHIHDGRGAQRVQWDLGSQNVKYAEASVVRWDDPGVGSKKISLVDLTGRKAPCLANDGSPGGGSNAESSAVADAHADLATGRRVHEPKSVQYSFGSDIVDAQIAGSSIIGLGGDPASGRCDSHALAGRLGRQETCIVNAAIMKSRYPHIGGKKFNKPIVVDLNLPVWTDNGA